MYHFSECIILAVLPRFSKTAKMYHFWEMYHFSECIILLEWLCTGYLNWADIFSDARKKWLKSLPTPLNIFCRTKQVHTFTFFLTKNSNSKNKNLHARHHNLVWTQNRKKIILKQQFWVLNCGRRFLRAQRQLRTQISAAEVSLPKFLKKWEILRGFSRFWYFCWFSAMFPFQAF